MGSMPQAKNSSTGLGEEWLRQKQHESAAAKAAAVPPTLQALKAGLLLPAAILQLAQEQLSGSPDRQQHIAMKCLEALAQHGAQPGIKSHPGYSMLVSCIGAMEPDGLLAAAEHLADVSSHIPPHVAEDIALAASIPHELDTRSVTALACLGRCAGRDTAAYQSLRQHVVSTATSSHDWDQLLQTLAHQQYSKDRDLLSLASSTMFQIVEQQQVEGDWVSWCGRHRSCLQRLPTTSTAA